MSETPLMRDQQLALKVPVAEVTRPIKGGLLKWIGNKRRFARLIVSFFPGRFGTYFEPFLGGGAVLAELAPRKAIGSDNFKPLMEIWQTLSADPEMLKHWYAERWLFLHSGNKVERYQEIKASYNRNPNGADLLFLCRSCYGGVVRFRQSDGFMSTPCGVHDPIRPATFDKRVDVWSRCTSGATFLTMDYTEAMELARPGDLIYCDPPYSDTQTIIYGAQSFNLAGLISTIERCKNRGVFVALSIDGTKKSGQRKVDLTIPNGLFERQVIVNCGRSMLRRFQMSGQSLEREVVTDRLLLTYEP